MAKCYINELQSKAKHKHDWRNVGLEIIINKILFSYSIIKVISNCQISTISVINSINHFHQIITGMVTNCALYGWGCWENSMSLFVIIKCPDQIIISLIHLAFMTKPYLLMSI